MVKAKRQTTVGDLRKAIEGLPDKAMVAIRVGNNSDRAYPLVLLAPMKLRAPPDKAVYYVDEERGKLALVFD